MTDEEKYKRINEVMEELVVPVLKRAAEILREEIPGLEIHLEVGEVTADWDSEEDGEDNKKTYIN